MYLSDIRGSNLYYTIAYHKDIKTMTGQTYINFYHGSTEVFDFGYDSTDYLFRIDPGGAGTIDFVAQTAGVAQMLYIDGDADELWMGVSKAYMRVTTGGVIFNETGAAGIDFTIESGDIADAFKVDAGDDLVKIGAGFQRGTTAIDNTDSPYTVLDSDNIILTDSSAGAITIAPTDATDTGRILTIVAEHGDDNTVTVDPGTPTISGAETVALDAAFDTLTLMADGTHWVTVNTVQS